MKISTKIIAGYGVLIALMVGLLAHQLTTIQKMQSTITHLSDVNFTAADFALRMRSDIELVEEFARKSFVSADPGYRERLREYSQLYESEMENVREISRSRQERAEMDRLAEFWAAFQAELARRQSSTAEAKQGIPDVLIEQLAQLRDQTRTVYLTAIGAITAEVKAFGQTSRIAATVSWIVAAAALALSGLVSLLIVQSISSPLRQLTQGTRALAEGKFFYRLDTTRRDEFGQLAKDFNSMTQRLNELDQMKKDFVAHVSHELKVPLASQQETIQLLLDQIPGPVNDKQKRLLELNLASCRRLSAMIGNLLDLSRMEAGVMEYELKRHNLADLVRTAAAEFQPRDEAGGASIDLLLEDQPVSIDCDADRILQVVRNLLGNAAKFSKGKPIQVKVAAASEIPLSTPESLRAKLHVPPGGAMFALLVVADSGPGVPDAHKEKIFEKFHQVKQGKKIPGQGAGLGLAISRTIVEAHHGALWVEDNPEGGSIFYLLIPPGETSGQNAYRASPPI